MSSNIQQQQEEPHAAKSDDSLHEHGIIIYPTSLYFLNQVLEAEEWGMEVEDRGAYLLAKLP